METRVVFPFPAVSSKSERVLSVSHPKPSPEPREGEGQSGCGVGGWGSRVPNFRRSFGFICLYCILDHFEHYIFQYFWRENQFIFVKVLNVSRWVDGFAI